MEVGFRKLVPWAELPAYAHEGDAGMDVRSVEELVIPPLLGNIFSVEI